LQIERTEIAQAHFNSVTSEIPITVSDDEVLDMFTDNTPLECGIENPEGCESCD